MLINLDVLKSEGASESSIAYFQSLEKEAWEPTEFMRRCIEDGKIYTNWIFKYITTINELKGAVEFYIEKGLDLYYAFGYCHELFAKDPALFKKAVEHHIEEGLDLYFAFKYCHKVFAKDSALFKKAVEYYMEKGWGLHDTLEYCKEAFANDPELHKKALEHQKQFS